MPDEKIKVNSYSGYKAEEIPKSFLFRGKMIIVTEIMDRWLEEGSEDKVRKRFFKVKGSDGLIYNIFVDDKTGEWFVRKTELFSIS